MPSFVGVDVGTSSTKAVVIDEAGTILDSATQSYEISSPKPNWFEQDPATWEAAARNCLERLQRHRPVAIGFTGQMHGMVLRDRNGEVLHPAILWNDQRTFRECEEWESTVGPAELRRRICNAPMTGLQAPKLLWMKRHRTELFERVGMCLLPKDDVVYKLTGAKATDPADAAGTGWFDVEKGEWWVEAIDRFEFDPRWFPAVSMRCVGQFQGANVYLAGGDQSANGVGTGCVDSHRRSLALGSSAVAFSAAAQPSMHTSGTLNCFNHISGGWLCMGVSLNGTLAMEKFADQFLDGLPAKDLVELAKGSKPGSNGVRIYPFFGGERCPINEPNLQPWFDIPDSATKADLSRGILEGIAFNLRRANGFLTEAVGTPEEIVASGGGSKSDLWLSILASVLGTPVYRTETSEGPAYGAAIVAAVQEGRIESFVQAARIIRKLEPPFHPDDSYDTAIEAWESGLRNGL